MPLVKASHETEPVFVSWGEVYLKSHWKGGVEQGEDGLPSSLSWLLGGLISLQNIRLVPKFLLAVGFLGSWP